MSDHYIEIITWNKKMILLYGDKLTRTQKAIGLRSNGLHTELNFVDRGQYFSCTCADGADGGRFKPIKRTHPYRQSIVRIPVTETQEASLWAKACEMADMTVEIHKWGGAHLHYGLNHIKYDKNGASFAFISKLRIWRMHPDDMICNEAVANVMLVEWPDLLVVDQGYHDARVATGIISPPGILDKYDKKDPATLTPDQFHYLVEYYFYGKQELTMKGE